MAKESTQQRISRDRAPRVQITYDVEVGDAIENKELPFVLGVLGDYSGQSAKPLPKMKDRKFVQIDQDNFNEALASMEPRIAMKVDNKLKNDDSSLSVELNFRKMEDFEPQNVAGQVEPLRQLLEARTRLADLKNKVVSNDRLEELLDSVVRDTQKLQSIHAENQPDETKGE